MREMSIREARSQLSHIEKLLEEEQEVLITKRGKPVAKLVSLGARQKSVPSHADLRAKMPLLRSSAELLAEERERF